MLDKPLQLTNIIAKKVKVNGGCVMTRSFSKQTGNVFQKDDISITLPSMTIVTKTGLVRPYYDFLIPRECAPKTFIFTCSRVLRVFSGVQSYSHLSH